jgi:hypothetical protein
VGPDVWKSYFKFTVIRNTWERVISMYLHLIGGGRLSKDTTFEQFLNSDWLKSKYNNLLRMLQDKEDKVDYDYIIRFDHLQEDFDLVASKIGLADSKLSNVHFRHYNRDLDTWYTAETAKFIHDKFRAEIDYFEFKYPGKIYQSL